MCVYVHTKVLKLMRCKVFLPKRYFRETHFSKPSDTINIIGSCCIATLSRRFTDLFATLSRFLTRHFHRSISSFVIDNLLVEKKGYPTREIDSSISRCICSFFLFLFIFFSFLFFFYFILSPVNQRRKDELTRYKGFTR